MRSLLAAVIVLGCVHAPPENAPRPEAIEEELASLERQGLTGVVLLAKGDRVLVERGFGEADREARRPMTAETGFDIGSITKVFTAAAILALERDGKLRRADSIARFLPDVHDLKRGITIGQLLAHTSGLEDIVNDRGRPAEYGIDYDYQPATRDEIVRRALASKLRSPPGVVEHYSNLGYSLLGVIVELASGEPYEAYLRRAVFEPAGMTQTGYVLARPAELATAYKGGERWGTPLDHPWAADGPSWNLRANGGMLSTARELFRWIRALDRGEALKGEAKAALFELFVHKTSRGSRVMGPAGSNGIFDAVYAWFVDEGRTVIVLTSDPRLGAEDVVVPLIKTMRAAGE